MGSWLVAGTALEPLAACAISFHHTKLHYAPTLATKDRETLWVVWRGVLSLRIALHGVGSCMSDLLAPLYDASALDPSFAARFGALTLLKIQLAMGRPLGSCCGGGSRLMKAVAGLQVLTRPGRNESMAHGQPRLALKRKNEAISTCHHLSSAVFWKDSPLGLIPFATDLSVGAALCQLPPHPMSLLARHRFPLDLT